MPSISGTSVSTMISLLSQKEKPYSEPNNERMHRVRNKLIIPSDFKKNLESALSKNKDAESAEKNYRKKISAKINLTKRMGLEEAERLLKSVSHAMHKVFTGIVPPPPPLPTDKTLEACHAIAFHKGCLTSGRKDSFPPKVERSKAEIMQSVRSSGQSTFAKLDITPDLLATFRDKLKKVL